MGFFGIQPSAKIHHSETQSLRPTRLNYAAARRARTLVHIFEIGYSVVSKK